MNLRIGMTKILFAAAPTMMTLAIFIFVVNTHAQGTSADTTSKSTSEASEIFRQQIYPYVQKNCSACHGDGKSDIEYAAPNWLHKDMASTEKQIQGYLRGDSLEKTKIYSQVKSQHWTKTSPSGLEKEYGEKNIENFTKIFEKYFQTFSNSSVIENEKTFNSRTTAFINQDKSNRIAGSEIGGIYENENNQRHNDKQLNIIQVSSGKSHTCALFENGRVKCWGDNRYGVLGLGDFQRRGQIPSYMGANLPFTNLGSAKVVEISAGGTHTCALFENGRVKCWGENSSGKLGLGDKKDRGGDLTKMGDRLPYVDLGSEKIAHISSGYFHTCALFENGRVKCWGESGYGYLGLGDKLKRGQLSSDMGENLPYVNWGSEKATQVSVGIHFSCVLLESGRVKCWGLNMYGMLGVGDDKARGALSADMGENLPYTILGAEKVIQISVGQTHACALLESRRMKCWGENGDGRLSLGQRFSVGGLATGMGDNLPYVDLGDAKVKQVSAGYNHTCVILEDNRVKCWGRNSYGQLGIPRKIEILGRNSSTEVREAKSLSLGFEPLIFISSGDRHVCANSKANIFCFGGNSDGQLGQGADYMYAPDDDYILPEYNSIVPPSLVQ